MPSASWSLQQSIFAKLTADATLLALLGAPRVYDDVPQGADLPYLTFGQSTARDWSTGSDDGNEHILTLHVWSQANGKRQAHEIMGAVRTALHDQPLTLSRPPPRQPAPRVLRSPPRPRRRHHPRHRPLPRRDGAGVGVRPCGSDTSAVDRQ